MSPADDAKIAIAQLQERIGALDQKAMAAHGRVDRLEQLLREDVAKLVSKLDEVVAWMNRGKGWAAAALLLSGLVGGVVVKLLTKLF